ncbi:MAG: hypothetical protein K8T91_15465, partial [Planctomycetes bacterium]|nr:hypothetical protein [Planctomycetota bacterium]
MPQPPVILEAAGLRLSFHAFGDRLAHTVGLVVGNRVVPLLASVEGTPADDWPPSPPLTTIELSSQAGVQHALLLGMAGRSHWSVAVVLNEAARRLEFEIATRMKEPATLLGSAYRTMVAARSHREGVELAVDGETIRVEAPSQQPAVRVTPDGLNVPVELPAGPFPQTVRWSYAICRLS